MLLFFASEIRVGDTLILAVCNPPADRVSFTIHEKGQLVKSWAEENKRIFSPEAAEFAIQNIFKERYSILFDDGEPYRRLVGEEQIEHDDMYRYLVTDSLRPILNEYTFGKKANDPSLTLEYYRKIE